MSDKSWLEASGEVVLKVLQMEQMKISEALLFENLLNWGCAQVKEGENLRAKIDSCLKLIRFCTMDYTEFSGLCYRPLPLTAKEKYKIFFSITQKSSKLLPEGFSKVKKPRCMGEVLYYDWISKRSDDYISVDNQIEPVSLTVTVEPEHYLTGLMLDSLTDINVGELVHLTCNVYSSEYPSLCIVSVTFNEIVPEDKDGQLDFPQPVLMKRGISYTIKVTYKHTAERQSASFLTGTSHSWSAPKVDDADDDKEKDDDGSEDDDNEIYEDDNENEDDGIEKDDDVNEDEDDNDEDDGGTTVKFAFDGKPVTDICGFGMAKKIM